jgi:8-amino-7-oxononanoate synthase
MPAEAGEDFLAEKLNQKREAGLYRELPHFENLIDFCSNDYLGFSKILAGQNEVFLQEKSGATGSRLISGNSALAEETENLIASSFGAESALIFNCGYMANLGLFSSVASRNDVIVHDENIHASVIDGIRLGNARRLKFSHNDHEEMEKILSGLNDEKESGSRIFVAVESLYSMDGDMAPLEAIASCCSRNNALLIVDEAHATGLFGRKGGGLVNEYRLEQKVFARVHTFGKALGLHGAAVLGSRRLKEFLVNHARSFIFTTALPPVIYMQIQQAFEMLPALNLDILNARIRYFHSKTKELPGYSWKLNDTPIQLLMIYGNAKAGKLAAFIQSQGFAAKAILSPTVKEGEERIRICLHAFNTDAEIDGLINAIKKYQP